MLSCPESPNVSRERAHEMADQAFRNSLNQQLNQAIAKREFDQVAATGTSDPSTGDTIYTAEDPE